MPTVVKKPGHNKIQEAVPFGYKYCYMCGETKKLSEYYASPTGKFGVSNRCKACRSAIAKSKYKPVVDKKKPGTKSKLTPEQKTASVKTSAAKYYEENKAKIIEKRKSRVSSLPKEEVDLLQKKQKHWNKVRKYQVRGATGKHTLKQWEELKLRYENKCRHCGKREPDITLTRDHIIPISRGGTNDIANIQPLCKSCNSKKCAKLESELKVYFSRI